MVKIQEIVVVFEGENNLLTIFTPEYIFWCRTNIYASNNNLRFPVIKSDEFLALGGQESTTKNSFDAKASVECLVFLEVFVDFYLVVFTFDSEDMLRWVDSGPH